MWDEGRGGKGMRVYLYCVGIHFLVPDNSS